MNDVMYYNMVFAAPIQNLGLLEQREQCCTVCFPKY